MSTDSIAWPRSEPVSRPFVDQLHEWITTVDHKRLGILYIVYALIFLIIGGVEATVMRIQLIRPHSDFVSPQVFNRMFTMHGTTMIFFVAMPLVFGFANYLLPLMIGARDMAFPRLNAFSFWLTAFGGLLLYFSLVGANGLYGDFACILSRPQHRFLDVEPAGIGFREHRHRHQYHRHHPVHALPRDDPR
jgi:cytochrome c oxidase subunit 1